MDYFLLVLLILLLIINVVTTGRAKDDVNFDENYAVTWGGDHVVYMNQGKDIQISMDKASGYFTILFLSLLFLFSLF